MGTDESAAMATIVAAAAPQLRAAGFKKRRHSFNRDTATGLVHVVNFWMAPKEPPAWTEIPGLRERLYGSFRLDFGVWVPQMTRAKRARGRWVNEYECDLRQTIGSLMAGRDDDLWWNLHDPGAEAAALQALRAFGLPWLDRFPDQQAILQQFEVHGSLPIGMPPAGPLDIAQLYEALGSSGMARATLERYVEAPHTPGHAEYLKTYLEEAGHPDLAERIVASPVNAE